jgi:hypothetical protein
MKLVIKKEHTGKNNYKDTLGCPIACALIDSGYKEVVVGGICWTGIKSRRFWFGKKLIGKLPTGVTMKAINLSRTKQTEDTIIEIPDPKKY